MRRAPSATADSDAFRAAAFRVAEGVRTAEALLADRRRDVFFDSDRAAWADLREAVGRLAALVAEHDPDESGLEIGCAPNGGIGAGQARAAAGMDKDAAPAGRHAPERAQAA